MKQISIVIPVYNRKADLTRCLESTRSDHPNYEVIVVDDGSTDGSYELAGTLGIPNMKLFQNPKNRGVNYTRNRGVEYASGAYIIFLDSDDQFMPDAINTVAASLEENTGVLHFLFLVSSNQNKNVSSLATTKYTDWLTEKVYGDFTHVIRRDVLLMFPFFEQFRAYEDLNWLRIIKYTQPQKVVPEIITKVDLDRTDNLTKTLRLKTTDAISGKFDYLKSYFQLYGKDLLTADPVMYKKKMQHALLLGIAAYKKQETKALLDSMPVKRKAWYKTGVSLFPAFALNRLIRSK
jgi:glycosyltransferase involved in cell wall biosynthesis